MKLRGIFGIFAKLYRPILKVLGVKDKTVAGKVADLVEKADSVIPEGKK